MPELTLEIGGRLYEVACEPGQEPSLERAARLLDAEASKLPDGSPERAIEKKMLLLAGLMLADTMTAVEERLRGVEDRLRAAEDRARIAEAKSAMLAANALKLETEAGHRGGHGSEADRLREENAAAMSLLERVLAEVNALADGVEARG
jgi:cell division protein ZapA